MVRRLLAILFIYVCTAGAWGILGGTVLFRTYDLDKQNGERVAQLWGTAQSQSAPYIDYETKKDVKQTTIKDNKTVTEVVTETEKHPVPLDSSDISANLNLDYRQKGLLWYSTYKVKFVGTYKFANPSDAKQKINFHFQLPAQQAIYDNLKLTVGSKAVSNVNPATSYERASTRRTPSSSFSYSSVSQSASVITAEDELAPGQSDTVTISYDSQGLDDWRYNFGPDISQVKNFNLKLNTDFDEIDFPDKSMSPSDKKKLDKGWELTWHYASLLTGYDVGIEMPKKLNPGPWVSKVTFFAPIPLFLFFFLLFMFTTIQRIKVHPMNYFFIGAAFFSFHLLLAYLVDHISIDLAFAISSVVSVFLVVSYMRLVVSDKFAYKEVGISQFIYLVVFSYTFFFEQYTGLVVTILCILTLFVMMQYTGRIDWDEAFKKATPEKPA